MQQKAAIKDRTPFWLTEINLRRNFGDSSSNNDSGNGPMTRERLATWAAAEAEKVARTAVRGAPVYRTAYALVEFQLCSSDADDVCANRFRRAYLVAESVDKRFFKMRYDEKKPTVFAMSHGCALKGDKDFGLACVETQYLEGKKGAGPVNAKIVEGRDRYIVKLNGGSPPDERQKLPRARCSITRRLASACSERNFQRIESGGVAACGGLGTSAWIRPDILWRGKRRGLRHRCQTATYGWPEVLARFPLSPAFGRRTRRRTPMAPPR